MLDFPSRKRVWVLNENFIRDNPRRCKIVGYSSRTGSIGHDETDTWEGICMRANVFVDILDSISTNDLKYSEYECTLKLQCSSSPILASAMPMAIVEDIEILRNIRFHIIV